MVSDDVHRGRVALRARPIRSTWPSRSTSWTGWRRTRRSRRSAPRRSRSGRSPSASESTPVMLAGGQHRRRAAAVHSVRRGALAHALGAARARQARSDAASTEELRTWKSERCMRSSAVVALGAIAFAVLRSPEKGQRKGPPPRPVAGAQGERHRQARADQRQEREDGAGEDGRERVARHVAGRLEGGSAGRQAAARRPREADLRRRRVGEPGRSRPSSASPTARARTWWPRTAAGATLADLHIGKTVGGYTMMRVDGKNDTWQATGIYPYTVGARALGLARPRHLRADRGRHRQADRRGAGRQAGAASATAATRTSRTTPSGRSSRPPATAPKTSADLDMAQANAVGAGAVEPARLRLRRRQEGRRRQRQAGADGRRPRAKRTRCGSAASTGDDVLRGVERFAAGLHGQEVLDRAHRAASRSTTATRRSSRSRKRTCLGRDHRRQATRRR